MVQPKPVKLVQKLINNVNNKGNKSYNDKNKRIRRGYCKKHCRDKVGDLSIVGSNAAGLISKKDSLLSLIDLLLPSIITIQESKCKKNGLFKVDG